MKPILAAALAFCTTALHAAPDLTAAARLYQAHCAQCHGAKLEGAAGPSLADNQWVHGQPTRANLVKLIAAGVPDKGMPAWSQTLSSTQIDQLAAYIQPGARRPAGAAASQPAAKQEPKQEAKQDSALSRLTLPKGFSIAVYAEGVESARSLAVSSSGIVYVGSRKAGKVYAVVDGNNDGVAEKVVTIASGLNNPIGVTLLNGALYVAEIGRVIRFDDIDRTYAAKPAYKVVKADLPDDKWHGEKVIKAGPDGKLYIPVGSPCNTCDKEDEAYSKIWRMNPDGSGWEAYAGGIRNTVGFAFHPVTKELWFTDNGPDEMGDNTPSCELNVAPKKGLHFGFPYCHGGVFPDPKYGKANSCAAYVPPVAKLGPHVAPLGLAFYTGTQFPAQYRNQVFVAEHGSWNRTQKIGYKVVLVTLHGNQEVTTTDFIDGFLQGDDVSGRPVDLAVLGDGSLLVSDDHAGRIYRVSYNGKR
ncbi:c-type cytochrome [Pseudoduganella chitinolytica]|uniref:PQQ-dependent sugar dehydrogenase n=1 Tax=Pseudoduganella chitinolytica TaxID=34070 RepID=A0ABY8BEE1_9BURK|nr:c-type cytochrome [Pseudoduganella chitinolytica]WEF33618.1 PQQ-dependent sugar dehydrogenase [Pseudoduganella chitinolytica]